MRLRSCGHSSTRHGANGKNRSAAEKAATKKAPAKKAAATMKPSKEGTSKEGSGESAATDPTKKATATKSSSKPPRKAAASAESSSQLGREVTEPRPGTAQDRGPDPATSPPQTGTPRSTMRCAGWLISASAPLADHHDRLAKAHEVLQEALRPTRRSSLADGAARLSRD